MSFETGSSEFSRIGFVLALALAMAMAMASCTSEKVAGGAGAGNPPQAQVTVSLKAEVVATAVKKSALLRDDGGEPQVRDSIGSSVTLTGLHCRMQSLEFHFPDSVKCDDVHHLDCDGDKISLNQVRDVNLLTGLVTPVIPAMDLPPGNYPRLRLEFVTSGGGHSNSSPQEYNVQIQGYVSEAGKADKLFDFSLGLNEGMDFEPAGGLAIKAGIANSLRLLWAVNHWFDEVDMLKCLSESGAPDSNGMVHFFGDDACDEAGKRIRKNIESSGKAENFEF